MKNDIHVGDMAMVWLRNGYWFGIVEEIDEETGEVFLVGDDGEERFSTLRNVEAAPSP